MTRLKRSALLTMTVALLTLAPAAAAYATDGANDRSDQTTDRVASRTTDKVTERTRDAVTHREPTTVVDRATERATERPRDRVENRTLRPWIKRCIHYLETHTDHELRRNWRRWSHVCRRVHWNLTHLQ